MENKYNQLKNGLLDILKTNTKYTIDFQYEYEQIAVWCESFGKSWSICFQNGDMNGKNKGYPVWTNDGANCGIDQFLEMLKEREEFKELIEYDTYWKYEYLKKIIDDFIESILEKEKQIEEYFENLEWQENNANDTFETIECLCGKAFEKVSHGDTQCPHCGQIWG